MKSTSTTSAFGIAETQRLLERTQQLLSKINNDEGCDNCHAPSHCNIFTQTLESPNNHNMDHHQDSNANEEEEDMSNRNSKCGSNRDQPVETAVMKDSACRESRRVDETADTNVEDPKPPRKRSRRMRGIEKFDHRTLFAVEVLKERCEILVDDIPLLLHDHEDCQNEVVTHLLSLLNAATRTEVEAKMERERTQHMAALSQANASVATLATQLTLACQRCTQLETELAKERESSKALATSLSDTKTKLSELQTDFAATQEKLTQSNLESKHYKECKDRVPDLESKLSHTQSQNAQLREQLATEQTHCQENDTAKKQACHRVFELNALLKTAQTNLTKLETRHHNVVHEELPRLRETLERTQHERDQAVSRAAQMQRDKEELSENQSALRRRIQQVFEENKQLSLRLKEQPQEPWSLRVHEPLRPPKVPFSSVAKGSGLEDDDRNDDEPWIQSGQIHPLSEGPRPEGPHGHGHENILAGDGSAEDGKMPARDDSNENSEKRSYSPVIVNGVFLI